MSLSFWNIIIIAAVVVLLFGRGKISELMGDVAQGIKSFKKGISDDPEEPQAADGDKLIEHEEVAAEGVAAPRAATSQAAAPKATRKRKAKVG